MGRKVAVTTDSTADLTPALLEQYHITVFPLYIEMNGQLYRDGLDVTPDDLYRHYRETGKIAHSSACGVEEYRAVFERLTGEGYDVVHVGLADYLSCTLQNARIAAEEVPGVYVVNSLRLSTGIGQLALAAAELAAAGETAEAIAQKLTERAPCLDVSFVLETLDYMHAGGRCSAVTRMGANLLKIKPQIVVYDDKMDAARKYRGSIEAARAQYVRDQLHDPEDICTERLFVTHSGVPEEAVAAVVEQVRQTVDFKEILVTRAGCVISCHCGPGTLGLLFFRKRPLFQ